MAAHPDGSMHPSESSRIPLPSVASHLLHMVDCLHKIVACINGNGTQDTAKAAAAAASFASEVAIGQKPLSLGQTTRMDAATAMYLQQLYALLMQQASAEQLPAGDAAADVTAFVKTEAAETVKDDAWQEPSYPAALSSGDGEQELSLPSLPHTAVEPSLRARSRSRSASNTRSRSSSRNSSRSRSRSGDRSSSSRSR